MRAQLDIAVEDLGDGAAELAEKFGVRGDDLVACAGELLTHTRAGYRIQRQRVSDLPTADVALRQLIETVRAERRTDAVVRSRWNAAFVAGEVEPTQAGHPYRGHLPPSRRPGRRRKGDEMNFGEFWRELFGDRSAAEVVSEFDLGEEGLDEWLGRCESETDCLLPCERRGEVLEAADRHHSEVLAELWKAVEADQWPKDK
jgi:hypothetical protein